jgi:uncharacterized MnhB-related membrane protein
MHMPLYITENIVFIIVVVGLIALPIAWIADAVLKYNGFGVLGNYAFILMGAYLGSVGIFLFFGSALPVMARPEMAFAAASLGAVFFLLFACFLKKLLMK